MRRPLALLSALFVFFWSGCAYASVTRPHPVVTEEYERTVRLVVLCPDGNMSGGSGVRIGGEAVLTAFHVVDCDGEVPIGVMIVTSKGKKYMATVEAEIRAQDVARLRVKGLPSMNPVAIAQPVLGQQACATFALPKIGRRCGEIWPDIEGGPPGDVHVDFVGEHGNSGSALWDEQGRLIGILVHLRYCQGTGLPQVCTAGATKVWPIRWIARA